MTAAGPRVRWRSGRAGSFGLRHGKPPHRDGPFTKNWRTALSAPNARFARAAESHTRQEVVLPVIVNPVRGEFANEESDCSFCSRRRRPGPDRYSLLAALIAVACIVAMQTLAVDINEIFAAIGAALDGAVVAISTRHAGDCPGVSGRSATVYPPPADHRQLRVRRVGAEEKSMLRVFTRLAREEKAQDLIEYALLSALLAVTCISGILQLTRIVEFFEIVGAYPGRSDMNHRPSSPNGPCGSSRPCVDQRRRQRAAAIRSATNPARTSSNTHCSERSSVSHRS